ncbi:DDE-type integrase/transposase/recombinase [Streptomyces sp. A5-4]|uniref:DDE-type integrase/transposase/recombinase n=1 Tax=Streptomyces sp. A5-4 TaxID=3384771 RepID=UPI003DA83917
MNRDFTAEQPDLVRAGDMTEIATGEGKLCLATVIDLFSRRLLGYAMAAQHDAGLFVAALNMAAATCGGDVRGVIFHSGRGSEGEFNWSSQHLLITEVCDGTTEEAAAGGAIGCAAAVGRGQSDAAADAFTGPA